jgi:signal transduction histidine kinase
MRTYEIHPSASRLIGSLRDIGYDFNTAVADLVDNSVAAGATHVQIDLRYRGTGSSVTISDDGHGMTESAINEALRFGSQRSVDSIRARSNCLATIL